MALLFTAALIFLPNIGLWSLYKEKQLMKSTDGGDQVGTKRHSALYSSIHHSAVQRSCIVYLRSLISHLN